MIQIHTREFGSLDLRTVHLNLKTHSEIKRTTAGGLGNREDDVFASSGWSYCNDQRPRPDKGVSVFD